MSNQKHIDNFYKDNGPCCAGCNKWRWHNSMVGECIKTAPVSGSERYSMIGIKSPSCAIESGHIITDRAHVCGDFLDTD